MASALLPRARGGEAARCLHGPASGRGGAVAEERRRLGPRLYKAALLPHTKERAPQHKKEELYGAIAEGKKSLKDLSNKISPTQGGFDWRQFPYSKAVASISNGVIKTTLFLTVASEIDFYWLFGIDRPEGK